MIIERSPARVETKRAPSRRFQSAASRVRSRTEWAKSLKPQSYAHCVSWSVLQSMTAVMPRSAAIRAVKRSTCSDIRENRTGEPGCSVPSVNITLRKVPPRSALERSAWSRSASTASMWTGTGNSTPWP